MLNKGQSMKTSPMTDYFEMEIPASSLCALDDTTFLVACSKPQQQIIRLISVKCSDGTAKISEIASFKGSRSLLLKSWNRKVFVGVDNKLLLLDAGEQKTVLTCSRDQNFFWHMCQSHTGLIYVQEYGEPPSTIFRSSNGEAWDVVISSSDVDSTARHFHSIEYDPYRNAILATLGDRNRVRIISLPDGQKTWDPIYIGVWQVLPIFVEKERVLFGMDSGIARGGILFWYPNKTKVRVHHLRWLQKEIQLSQMAELKQLRNGLWLAALGAPQAIVASHNLNQWYVIYSEGSSNVFQPTTSLAETQNHVAFVTGKHLVILGKDLLSNSLPTTLPQISTHIAVMERIKGVGFSMKKRKTLNNNVFAL
jgi:hypothetical protein